MGMMAFAGVVLGSLQAIKWALHGDIALAWVALLFGVAALPAFLACLWLYVRRDADDPHPVDGARRVPPGIARPAHPHPHPHPPAHRRPTAQDRAWLNPQGISR